MVILKKRRCNMYTPKDLKNEGQHIFFKLLSFVIYSNLLYVVLLFLTVMLYAKITGEYSSVESIINQLDTRFFTILNEISVTSIMAGSLTIALAIATRCFCPPESLLQGFLERSPIPTAFNASRAFSFLFFIFFY